MDKKSLDKNGLNDAGVTVGQYAVVGLLGYLEDAAIKMSGNFFRPNWGLDTLRRFQRNNAVKFGLIKRED